MEENREGRADELLRIFDDGLPRPDSCYRLGTEFAGRGMWKQAIFWYELATRTQEVGPSTADGEALRTWLPHLQLCVCYDRLGEPDKANEHNEIALRFAPNHPSMLANRTYLAGLLHGRKAQAAEPAGLLLSVLVPSVPERLDKLTGLLRELERQSAGKPVEIVVMLDNRKRTIGAKRNRLIDLAQGRFVAFVDDDDRLMPHYADALLERIREHPDADCIVFDVDVYLEGAYAKVCKYGQEYAHGMDDRHYYRKPNHLMCYAAALAARHKFLEISYGEDDEWAARASRDIVRQVRIADTLYRYEWVSKPAGWYAPGG